MATGKSKFRFFLFFFFVCITLTAIASTVEGNDDASTALVAVEEQKRTARNVESINPAADGQVKNPPLARKKRQTCGVLCRVSGRFSCAVVCSILDDELAIDACQHMCGGGHVHARTTPIVECSSCGLHMNFVCGSDGITYRNVCWAQCHYATIAFRGPCYVNSSPTGRCACTREYNPVCGDDGNSYDNPCLMRCAGAIYVGPAVFPGGIPRSCLYYR